MSAYQQGDYDKALDRHDAARKALADAKHMLELAEIEMDAAERELGDQEAYPGISAWGHVAAHEAGGELAGRPCSLGRQCKIHGEQVMAS